MCKLFTRIVLIVVLLAWGLTEASAQYTIRRAEPQRSESKELPKLLETLSESRITAELDGDYYNHAAWIAERNRMRKERNTFEVRAPSRPPPSASRTGQPVATTPSRDSQHSLCTTATNTVSLPTI